MPSNFAFGFDEDNDIDEIDETEENAQSDNRDNKSEGISFVPPQLHLLHDILSTFPSQLSFNTISVPSNNVEGIKLVRRDLFDIRTQLMAEDGNLSADSISGLSEDDIIPKIYEGGFKTWECSVDLSDYIWSNFDMFNEGVPEEYTVIELGAGTALPTITFARKYLASRSQHPATSTSLQLCVADYNCSVLELATIPNLYLGLNFLDGSIVGHEVEIEPAVLQRFEEKLSDLTISAAGISGSWTQNLVNMISSVCQPAPGLRHETIVLASETIYSPASISDFTASLVGILSRAQENGSRARGLVAAKRVYFGVGGSTDEFLRVLTTSGGQGKIVWETQGLGVGRVIIEVTIPEKH